MFERTKREQRETAYRIYVTDTLQIIAKSLGEYPTKRYAEIYADKPTKDKTGEEIVQEVIRKAGLKIKDECI